MKYEIGDMVVVEHKSAIPDLKSIDHGKVIDIEEGSLFGHDFIHYMIEFKVGSMNYSTWFDEENMKIDKEYYRNEKLDNLGI